MMNSQGLSKEQLLTTHEIEAVEQAIINGEEVIGNVLKRKLLVGRLSLLNGLYQLAIEREQRPSYLFAA